MIDEAFFSEKYQIVVYGCGINAGRIVLWMKRQGIKVHFCVDSSKEKQGTYFMEEHFIQPPDLLRQHDKKYHIIISLYENKDIFGFLHSCGYIFERDFIDFRCLLKYWSGMLVSYIQKEHKRAKFIFAPNIRRMQNRSALEQSLLNIPVQLVDRLNWLQSFPVHIRECYRDFTSDLDDYLRQIFTGSEVLEQNGTYIQKNMRSKYVNVSGGMRFTTDQPEYYRHIVHFFGNSYVYSFGVEDKYTVASCLQRNLNRASLDCLVMNYGVRGLAFENYINKIKSATVESNDDILLYFREEPTVKETLMSQGISYIDLTEFLTQCRSEDIFFDWDSHLNYKGNIFVANQLFELIYASKTECLAHLSESEKATEYRSVTEEQDFKDYISMVHENTKRGYEKLKDEGVKGGIVMNCNPFTLGHLHLIQVAAQIVDYLYVFVVSENRSEFDFEDRLWLVQEGTKDISNVIVVPSGKFMISTATFPAYFSKNDSKFVDVDMSKDVHIFGSAIAKELGITIRFLGEEPYDTVTKQYNNSLQRILPKYHIKVLEIPRIKVDHEYVSATVVRKLWHDGELQKLKKYVPECTYNYLIEKSKI